MPNAQASLHRFSMTHQGHGGRLEVVKDNGGRAWLECTRCGIRILAPPEPGDGQKATR